MVSRQRKPVRVLSFLLALILMFGAFTCEGILADEGNPQEGDGTLREIPLDQVPDLEQLQKFVNYHHLGDYICNNIPDDFVHRLLISDSRLRSDFSLYFDDYNTKTYEDPLGKLAKGYTYRVRLSQVKWVEKYILNISDDDMKRINNQIDHIENRWGLYLADDGYIYYAEGDAGHTVTTEVLKIQYDDQYYFVTTSTYDDWDRDYPGFDPWEDGQLHTFVMMRRMVDGKYYYSLIGRDLYTGIPNIPNIPEYEKPGFRLKRDGYGFVNQNLPFGYPKNAKQSFASYQEVFGPSFTQEVYDLYASAFGGNCFGMVVTANMFFQNILNKDGYITPGTTVNSVGVTKKANLFYAYRALDTEHASLKKLIECYQIYQKSEEYDKTWEDRVENWKLTEDTEKNKKVISGVLTALYERDNPMIVDISWPEDGGNQRHAMLVDSGRDPEELEDDWIRIWLYDPNCPYYAFGEEYKRLKWDRNEYSMDRCFDLNLKQGTWRFIYPFKMGKYEDEKHGFWEGSYLDGSMMFIDVRELPTSFDKKARLSSEKFKNITYDGDTIVIKDSTEKTLYEIKQGIIQSAKEGFVRSGPFLYCNTMLDNDSEDKTRWMTIPNGQYTYTINSGTLSVLSNQDYIGVRTDQPITVKDIDSTTLSISAAQKSKVHVVIEDIADANASKYTSVGMDIEVDDSGCTLSLKGDTLSVNTDDEQQVEVHLESNDKNGYVISSTSYLKNGYNLKNQSAGGATQKKTVSAPAKVTLKKASANKKNKSLKLTWKKVNASGYEVQYALDKKFKKGKKTKTVKSAAKTSLTIKKLKKGKKYFVRVRAYNMNGKKKLYGKWSKIKVVKL